MALIYWMIHILSFYLLNDCTWTGRKLIIKNWLLTSASSVLTNKSTDFIEDVFSVWIKVKSQLLLCQSRLAKICISTTLISPETRQVSDKSRFQEQSFFSPDSTLHVRHVCARFRLDGKSFLSLQSWWSSSCRAASTDIPDPLSPLLPIVHRLWQVSGLHCISSHSCCMYVQAGRPAFARHYVWVHRGTSLMNSSLIPQQCAACLVHLAWIVFVMRGRWSYSWCLVGCCRQNLINNAHNILV